MLEGLPASISGHSERRQSLLRRPAKGVIGLAATLCVVLSAPTAATPMAAAAVPAQPGTCGLPLVHDSYDGFHVGVPTGWDVSTMGGEISVEPSPESPEGALL